MMQKKKDQESVKAGLRKFVLIIPDTHPGSGDIRCMPEERFYDSEYDRLSYFGINMIFCLFKMIMISITLGKLFR